MSEKWYKTFEYGKGKIESVEIERETDNCVYIKELSRVRRVNKCGQYENYFRTFEDAKQHLIDKMRREHDSAVYNLDMAKKNLEIAESLKPL